MPALLSLRDLVRINLRVPVEAEGGQLILTLTVGEGRKQTVLVSVHNYGEFEAIEVRSRCGVIADAKLVRSAIKRNFDSEIGGLVMSKVDSRFVLDLVHRIAVPSMARLDSGAVLNTINLIAVQADNLEKSLGDADVF